MARCGIITINYRCCVSHLVLLSKVQMRCFEPFFPRLAACAGWVIGGIIYVIWHGLHWNDAPGGCDRQRRATTGSSAGVALACSDVSSLPWRPRPTRRSG